MQEVGDENKIEKRKVDKRTLYAIMVCLFISICLRLIWLFDISKISWIQPLIPYRKFILSFLLIGPVVYIVERASLSTLGFTLGDWKRTFIVTVLTSISVFLVGYLVALFWKHMGQLRIEGDMVYFVGNRLSPVHITPAVLYVLFLEQVSEVALPEEIIYRGYFQSRLSYTWKPAICIMGSTLLFAIDHIDRPLMLIHLMILGPIFGFAFYYSRSIYPTVIAHCLANIGSLFILKHIALH